MNGDKPKKRILIIEDERSLAMLLRLKLQERGYDVEVSFDGEDGYQRILAATFDLVLLDLLIPKLLGLDLLADVRKNSDEAVAKTPVMILTNYPEPQYLERCKKLGIEAFIVKADHSTDDIIRVIVSHVEV